MTRQGTPRRRARPSQPAAARLSGGRLSPSQLRQLAVDCMLDQACYRREGEYVNCGDPEHCGHDAQRITPLEFVEWVLARLGPAPRPRPGLSDTGRARIIAGQARRRARERGQLIDAA